MPKPAIRPTLSIVIPVFNEENYLSDCLESIKRQTIKPLEVIVVDNNSTDGSVKIAKEAGATIITEQDQGIIFARNRGFDQAKGDLIAKLDADTRLYSNWTEEVLHQFSDPATNGLSGPVSLGQIKLSALASWIFNTATFLVNGLLIGNNMLLGSNLVIRKDAWMRVKSSLHMRTDIWEDLDLALAMDRANLKIARSSKTLVEISQRRALDGALEVMQRLMGWPLTYWPYNKFSAIIAVFLSMFSWVTIMILRPITRRGFNKQPFQ